MKYIVTKQQCRGNPLLQFPGDTEHCYIVDSYIYANNNKKGTYFCIDMATGYANMPQCNFMCTLSILLPLGLRCRL
jgi:hypothetical protein